MLEINRIWAMPNKNTFEIKPIKDIIKKYITGFSIDPFANKNKFADLTNDIDNSFSTDYHLDAVDFLKIIQDNCADTLLFDPPFSSRQVAESYKKVNRAVNMQTTQGSYWSALKKEISRVVKNNGVAISCGWNSGGIGMKYGFHIIEILLVPHGGIHNDTIVVVERKLKLA